MVVCGIRTQRIQRKRLRNALNKEDGRIRAKIMRGYSSGPSGPQTGRIESPYQEVSTSEEP